MSYEADELDERDEDSWERPPVVLKVLAIAGLLAWYGFLLVCALITSPPR